MKKPEESKLTREGKIKKTSRVILSVSEGSFNKAVSVLKNGGIVIFPTDTVYGIGCRFDNKDSLDRIHKIKKSPQNQPFPILVSSKNQVRKLAKTNKLGEKLMEKYWPGGLTIILKAKSKDQKIGFRMPDSDLVKSLISKLGVPIIGTSANFYGQKSSTNFEELNPKFIKQVDFVIKGKCQKGIESTVVDATINPPKILRQGVVEIE